MKTSTAYFLSGALVALLLSACSSPSTSTSAEVESSGTVSEQLEASVQLKAEIETHLHQFFRGDALSKLVIDVGADGTVALSGTVATQKDKDTVLTAVREVQGVLVVNETIQTEQADEPVPAESISGETESSGTVTL